LTENMTQSADESQPHGKMARDVTVESLPEVPLNKLRCRCGLLSSKLVIAGFGCTCTSHFSHLPITTLRSPHVSEATRFPNSSRS